MFDVFKRHHYYVFSSLTRIGKKGSKFKPLLLGELAGMLLRQWRIPVADKMTWCSC